MGNYHQKVFFILGIMLLIITVGPTILVGIATGTFNLLTLFGQLSLVYMCLACGYLVPHLKNKDERAKLIRYQAGFYSLIGIIICIFLLITGSIVGFFIFEGIDLLQILVALTTFIVFTSQIIVSKKI